MNKNILNGLVKYFHKGVNGIVFFSERKYFSRLVDLIGNRTSKKLLKSFENDAKKFKNSTFPVLLSEFLFLQVWPYSQMFFERQALRNHRYQNFQSWNGFHSGCTRYVHPSLRTVKIKSFKSKKRKSNIQINNFGSLNERPKTKISPNVGRKFAKTDMYSIIVSNNWKGLNRRHLLSAKKKCEDVKHFVSNVFCNKKSLLENTTRTKRSSTKFRLKLLPAITKTLISASHKKNFLSNILFVDKKGAVVLKNLNMKCFKTEGKVHKKSKLKKLIPVFGLRKKQTFLEMGKFNCFKLKNNFEMFTQCYSTQSTQVPSKIQKEHYCSKSVHSKKVPCSNSAKPGLKTNEKQGGSSLSQKKKDTMSEMYLKDMSSKLHRTIVEIVTEFPIVEGEKRQLIVFDRAVSNVKSMSEKDSAQKIKDIDIQFASLRKDEDEDVIKSVNFGSLLFFEGISKMAIYKSKGLTEEFDTVSVGKPKFVKEEMYDVQNSNYFGRVFVHNGLLNISFPEVLVSTETPISLCNVPESKEELNVEVVKSNSEKIVLTSPSNVAFFQVKNQTQGVEVASKSVHNTKALELNESEQVSLDKDQEKTDFKSKKTDHFEKVFILQLPSKISFSVHNSAPDDVNRIVAHEGSNDRIDDEAVDCHSSNSQKKKDNMSKDIFSERDLEFDDFRSYLPNRQTTKDFNLSSQKVETFQNKEQAPKDINFETDFEVGEESKRPLISDRRETNNNYLNNSSKMGEKSQNNEDVTKNIFLNMDSKRPLINDGHGRISKNDFNANPPGEKKSGKNDENSGLNSHHERLMILLLPSRRLFNMNKLANEDVERKVANDRDNKETESLSGTKETHDINTSRYFENVHNRYGLTKMSLPIYATDKNISSSGKTTDAGTKHEDSSEKNVKSDEEDKSISKSYSRRLLLPHNQAKMFLFTDTFHDETMEDNLKEESVHRPGMKYGNVGFSHSHYSSPHSTSDKLFYRKLSNKVPDEDALEFRSRRDEENLETKIISGQKSDIKRMDNTPVQLNETLFDNFFFPQPSEKDGIDFKKPGYLVNIKKDFGEDVSSLVKLFHCHGINNVSVVGPDVTPEHLVDFDDYGSSFRSREPAEVNNKSKSVLLTSDFSKDPMSNLCNMLSPGASFRGESMINDCEKEIKNNCEFLCMSDGDGRVSFFNDEAADEKLFSMFGENEGEIENIIGPNLFVSQDEKICLFKSVDLELTSSSIPESSGLTVPDDSECLPSPNMSDLECITFKAQDEVYSPAYPRNNLLVVDNIAAQSKSKIHYQSKTETKGSGEEPKTDENSKKRESETKIKSNYTPPKISANKKDNNSSKIMIGVNDINDYKSKLIYEESNYAPGYPRGDDTTKKKETSKTAKLKKDSSPLQSETEQFKSPFARKMFSVENISLSGRSKIIKSFSDRQMLKVSQQNEEHVEPISKPKMKTNYSKSNMDLAKVGSFDQAVQNQKRISNMYNEPSPGDKNNYVKSENKSKTDGSVPAGQDGGIQKYLDKLSVVKPKTEIVESSVMQHTAKQKEKEQNNSFSVRKENVEIKKVENESKNRNLQKKISFADTTIISPFHCKLKQSKDQKVKPSESVTIMTKKNTTEQGEVTFKHHEELMLKENIKKISEVVSGGESMIPKTPSRPEPTLYTVQNKVDNRTCVRAANKSTHINTIKSDKETKINESLLEKMKNSQMETEKLQLKGKIQESKLESIIKERNERIMSILNEKVTMSGSETDFNVIQALESKRNDKLKTLLNELTQKLSLMKSKEVLREKSITNKANIDKIDEGLIETKEDETNKDFVETRESKVTIPEDTSKQTFQHQIDQATQSLEKMGKSSKNPYEQGRIFGIISNKQNQQNESVVVPIDNRKHNEHYQKCEDKLEEQTETILKEDSKYNVTLDHLTKIITTIQNIENDECGKILVVQEKPQKNLLSLICNKTCVCEMGSLGHRGFENKMQLNEKIVSKKAEQVESKSSHINIYKYDKKLGAVSAQKPACAQTGQKSRNVENKPLTEKSERTFITSESNKLSVSKSDQKMGTLGSKIGTVGSSETKWETSGSTQLPVSLFQQRLGPVEGRMESTRTSDQEIGKLSGSITTVGKTDQESKAMEAMKSNRMEEVTRAKGTTMGKLDQKCRTFESKSTEVVRSEAKGKENQHKPFIAATVGQKGEGLSNKGTTEAKSDQRVKQLEDKTIKANEKEEAHSVAESNRKVENKSAIKEKSNGTEFKNSFITMLPNRKVEPFRSTSTTKSDEKDEFQNKFITMARPGRKPEAVDRMTTVAIAKGDGKRETEDKLAPMFKSDRMGKGFENKSITMTTSIAKSDLEGRSMARLRSVGKVEAVESKPDLSDRKGEPFEHKIASTNKVDLKVETESNPTSMIKSAQKIQEECKVALSASSDQKVESLESKSIVMAKSDRKGDGLKSGSIPVISSDQKAGVVESKLSSKAKSDQKGEGIKSKAIPMMKSDQKVEVGENKLVSKAKSDQKVGTLESNSIGIAKSDRKGEGIKSKAIPVMKSDQKVEVVESKLVSKAKPDRKEEGIKSKAIPMMKSDQKVEVGESMLSPKSKSDQKVKILESEPKSVLKLGQSEERLARKPAQKNRLDKKVTRKRSPMVKSDLNFRLAGSTTSLVTRSKQKTEKLENESQARVKKVDKKMGTEPTQIDKIEPKIEKEEIAETVESKLAIETERKMEALWRPSMTKSEPKVERVESKPTIVAKSEQKVEKVESEPAIVAKSEQKLERVESEPAIVTKKEQKAESEPSTVIKSDKKGDTLKSTPSSKRDCQNWKISEIKPIVESKGTYIFNFEKGKSIQSGSAITAKLIEKMELLTSKSTTTDKAEGKAKALTLHTTKTGLSDGLRTFESKPRAASKSNDKMETLATKPRPVLSSIHRWESLRNKDKASHQSDKPEVKQADTKLNTKNEIERKSDEKVEILANNPIIIIKTDQNISNTTAPVNSSYQKVEQSESESKLDDASGSVKRIHTSEIHPQTGRTMELLEIKVTPKTASSSDYILGKMEKRSVKELKTMMDIKPVTITKTDLKPICKSCEQAEAIENETLQKVVSDEIFGITDRSSTFKTNIDRIAEAESKPVPEILCRILDTDTKTTSKAETAESKKSEQEIDAALFESVNVAEVVEKLEKHKKESLGILKSDPKPLESKLQTEKFDDAFHTAHLPTSKDNFVSSRDKVGNQKLQNLNNENLAKLEDAFRKSKQQSENKETNTSADIKIEKVKSHRNVFIRKDLSEAVKSFDLVSKAHNDSHGTSIELNLKCTVNRVESPDVSVTNYIPTGDNSSWKDIGQKKPFIESKPLNVVKPTENAESPITEMKSKEDFGFNTPENSKSSVQRMQQKVHPRSQINPDERKDPMEEAPLRRALPPELTNALELLRKKKDLGKKLNFEHDILEKTRKYSDLPEKSIGIENCIPPLEKETACRKLEVSNKKVEEKKDLREVEGKSHPQLTKSEEKNPSQLDLETNVTVLLKSASKDETLIAPAVVDSSVAHSKPKQLMIDAQEALKQLLNETSVPGLHKKEVSVENRRTSCREEAVKSVPTTKRFIREKNFFNQNVEDTFVKDANKSKVVIVSEKKQKHPRDEPKRVNVKVEATFRPDIPQEMSKEEKEFKKQVALVLGKEKSELDMIEEGIRNIKRNGIIKMDDIKTDKIQPDPNGMKSVPFTNNEDTKKLADLKTKLGNSLKISSHTDVGANPKNMSISELRFKKKHSNVDLKMKQKLFDKPFPIIDNSLEQTGWSKVPQAYEGKMSESSFKKKMKDIATEQKKKETQKAAMTSNEQEGVTEDKIMRSLNYVKIKKNDSMTDSDPNLHKMTDSTIIPSESNVLTREIRKKLIMPRTPPVLKEKIDKLNKMRGIRPKSKKIKSAVRNKFNPYNLTSPNSLHRKKDNEEVLNVPETRSLSRRKSSANKSRYQHVKVYSLIPNPDLSKNNNIDKRRKPITLLPCTSPNTVVHRTTQEMMGFKKAKYVPRTITFEKCYNAIKEAEEKNVCKEQSVETCEPHPDQESLQDDSYQCHPANKFIQINPVNSNSCSTQFDIAHTSKYDIQPYYQKESEGCQSLMKLAESSPSGESKDSYSLMSNMMTSVKSTLQDLPSSFGRFSRDPRKVLGELSGIVSHSSVTLKSLQNKIELLQKKIKCDFQKSKMDSPCRQCVNILDNRVLSATSSNVINKKKPSKVFYKVKKNQDNFHSKPLQKKVTKVSKGMSLYPGRMVKVMDEEKEPKPCPQLSYGDVLTKMHKGNSPTSKRPTM